MHASLELFDQKMYCWDTSAFFKLEHVVFCLFVAEVSDDRFYLHHVKQTSVRCT